MYVTTTQFRDNLSKYLTQVASGRYVFITKPGKVVAKVTPYDQKTEVKPLENKLAGSERRLTETLGIS